MNTKIVFRVFFSWQFEKLCHVLWVNIREKSIATLSGLSRSLQKEAPCGLDEMQVWKVPSALADFLGTVKSMSLQDR